MTKLDQDQVAGGPPHTPRGRSSPVPPAGPPQMPLGQRLYDNWPLLMIAGIVIMAVIYTGWGLWEISSLPPATLP